MKPALVRNPVAPLSREKPKWRQPRGESTDAEHWGGPIRRSDEGAVMGLEQRDRIRWLPSRDNWKQEDAMNATDKPSNDERRVYLMGAV